MTQHFGHPILVPRVKALSPLVKAITEKKDKRGRRVCYDDVAKKRVKCPPKEGEGDKKPPAKKKPEQPARKVLAGILEDENLTQQKLAEGKAELQKILTEMGDEEVREFAESINMVIPSGITKSAFLRMVDKYVEQVAWELRGSSLLREDSERLEELKGRRGVEGVLAMLKDKEVTQQDFERVWNNLPTEQKLELASRLTGKQFDNINQAKQAADRAIAELLGHKTRPVPEPPEPGFTGVDTLGRHWQDGKLVPGEEEPPKRLKGPNDFDYDPKRVFKLSSLTDGGDVVVPQRIEQALVDSEIFQHFLSGALWERSPIERRLAEQHPQHMNLLHKEGYLEPFYTGGKAPPWTLTTKGKLAVAKMMGVDDFADPTTMQGISQVTLFYKMLNNTDRRKLLDHFGIRGEVFLRGGIPRDFDSEDFREVLFRMAERLVNPKTTFELIREDEKLQDFVAELTRLSSRDTKLREWDREMGALKEELPKHFLSTTSLALVQSRIGYLRMYVKNSPTKRKARQILAKLEDIHKRFRELQERKVAILREDSNTQYNAVSEKLRSRVQDPQAIVVTEYTDSVSERAKTNVGRTLELLEGVLQRGSVGLPPFRVYVDPNKPHRASYSYLLGNAVHLPEMSCDISSAIHELMHGVEANSPEIIQAIQEFRRGRIGDEKGVDLGNRFGLAYSTGEIGYKDRFDLAFQGDEYSAYYTGKKYDSLSTEILSMGVEKLYEDPSGFARRDPEFCAFIVGILDGTLRKKPIPDSSKQDVLIPEVIE